MADKEAKKQKENEKEEAPQDPNEKISKKSKLILFAGIGGVLLLALIIGGFIVFKTMSEPHAENSEISPSDTHASEQSSQHKAEPSKKAEGHASEPAKKEEGHGGNAAESAKKEDVKGTENFGDTYTIPRMDLNLGNPIENRFLRIALAIEYRGGEEQSAELKKREIQIKDIIITTVSTKTRLQLLSGNGKELLRREVLNKINEVSDRPIQNVFFTEFLVE